MIVDFHSHTNKSDGTLTPQALADFMGERNVEIYSISDHDTLAAYGDFTPKNGARVIPAIEINTTWRENEVHVLGYNVPLGGSAIDELLEYNQAERGKRAERMVDAASARRRQHHHGSSSGRSRRCGLDRKAARRQGDGALGHRARRRQRRSACISYPARPGYVPADLHDAGESHRGDSRGRRHRGARASRAV